MELWFILGFVVFGLLMLFAGNRSVQYASFSLLTGLGLAYAVEGFNEDTNIVLSSFIVGSVVVFAFFALYDYKNRGPKYHYFKPGTTVSIVLVNDKIALGKLSNGKEFAVQTADNLGDISKPPKGVFSGQSYEVESYYVPGDFLLVKIPTMTA